MIKINTEVLVLAPLYPQCTVLYSSSSFFPTWWVLLWYKSDPEFTWRWTKKNSPTQKLHILPKISQISCYTCVHSSFKLIDPSKLHVPRVKVTTEQHNCEDSPLNPQPGPTNPPSGLDYKSMEEFINEGACRATMESNRGHLRQYGPGHSDG